MLTDLGREQGVRLTDVDRSRVAHLGRWYSLDAEQVARFESGLFDWDESLRTPEFESRVYAIKRRFAKLVRIQENAGSHTGPFVGSALSASGRTVWHATRYGITAASLPWRFRSDINPQFADHAMMAADIGMQVESLGFRVYSERELASGTDKNGEEIVTPIESHYTTANGVKVGKKPDVVVASHDLRSFHAIEVERDQNRALSTYVEKLRAYDDNPALVGVWYLCASEATANRVKTAATRVFGDRPFALRVKVVGGGVGWNGIPNLRHEERFIEDLRRMT